MDNMNVDQELMELLEQMPQNHYDGYSNIGAIFVILLWVFLLFALVFAFALLIVMIIGRWMLFTKCNQAGWKSIIPFYGNWIYTVNICKCHWLIFVFELICFLFPPLIPFRIILKSIKNYNLAIKTKQSPTSYIWFTVFSVPIDAILGLCRKSYKYNIKVPTSEFGFIGTKS